MVYRKNPRRLFTIEIFIAVDAKNMSFFNELPLDPAEIGVEPGRPEFPGLLPAVAQQHFQLFQQTIPQDQQSFQACRRCRVARLNVGRT